MTLNSSVVIFQALKPLQPQWPQWPQQPQWPRQPHFIKNFTDPDGLIIPSTQMTTTSPFLWNRSSKIKFFTNNWYSFCRRLLRPANVIFFENLLMKHKYPHLLKTLGTINQKKYCSFYPSETIQKVSFEMRYPVLLFTLNKSFFLFITIILILCLFTSLKHAYWLARTKELSKDT